MLIKVLHQECPVWRGRWSWRLKMGPRVSPVATSYRLPIVTTGLSLTVFTVLRLVTDRRKWSKNRRNFIGRQTVKLCNEIDHWFIQQNIATVQRTKERATIGLCWSDLFVFLLMHCRSSDDSDASLVSGDASYLSSSSLLLLLLSAVRHSASV